MLHLLSALFVLPFALAFGAPTLHLVGDSTICNYPLVPPNPQRGWGQQLPVYFRPELRIVNHAIGGQSTRSFLKQEHWNHLLSDIRAGDHVLIQFGHNDQKRDNPSVYAAAETEYAENLRRMIVDTRTRGAFPLLATSVVRRRWRDGIAISSLGDYPGATRRIATETGTPLLELHDLTLTLVQSLGPEGSKRLFLWIPAGAFERQPQGWQDDSHFSVDGANCIAFLAVQELLRLDHPLVRWLRSRGSKLPTP